MKKSQSFLDTEDRIKNNHILTEDMVEIFF